VNPRDNPPSRARDIADQTRRAQGILRRNMAINTLLTLPAARTAIEITRQGTGKLIGTLR
jgi:hypothetical protein